MNKYSFRLASYSFVSLTFTLMQHVRSITIRVQLFKELFSYWTMWGYFWISFSVITTFFLNNFYKKCTSNKVRPTLSWRVVWRIYGPWRPWLVGKEMNPVLFKNIGPSWSGNSVALLKLECLINKPWAQFLVFSVGNQYLCVCFGQICVSFLMDKIPKNSLWFTKYLI